MADILDENGLQIDNLTTRLNNLIIGMQAIYGTDINLESNSPDSQFLNIFANANQDALNLLQYIYNSFDPDLANGINLDSRVAINNIQRKGATYTLVNIDITVNQPVSLKGLDENSNDPNGTGYTISDNSGNNFILLVSQNFTSAGTYTVEFRSQNIGNMLTTANTINIQVSIILGVVSVNNPSTAIQIGTNEELDSQLRYRRQISTMVNAQGYLPSLQSQLLNLSDVTDALVFDNPTSSTTVEGIPPFGIWCIVLGGTPEEIANTIYKGRWGGEMAGSQTYLINQINGTTMTIKYDIPISANLYIKIIMTDISGSSLDITYLKNKIYENISYKINQTANSTDIVYFLKGLLTTVNISDCTISSNGTNYYQTLNPTTKQYKFILSTSRITINGV
jgi:uncharacterized phage protein gp47/JayE